MNLIKLNKNIIIREEDKMIFSANDMKIYKFNNKGFILINEIKKHNEISKNDLFELINTLDNFTDEEYENLINKMIKYNIVKYDEFK